MKARYTQLDDWLRWLETLHPRKIDLGLERVAEVARRLDLLPATSTVITVAGTNGKGSSVALLEAILQADGSKTGCYTSPHIHYFNERIHIDGQEVDDTRIVRAFAAIDSVLGETTLSYFEFGTLAALWLFKEAAVDVTVLEVGLGGRLDAVNIVDADVALLTSIGLDHTDWLGESLDGIALEKAAIARPGHPLVCGEPGPPALMLETSRNRGVVCKLAGEDFGFQVHKQDWEWWGGGRHERHLPFPALLGNHQIQNAAAVLEVLSLLPAQQLPGRRAIDEGLQSVKLAGRHERFDVGFEVVLDVSHNPHGMKKLVATLQERPVQGRTVVLFGVMADKDVEGLIKLLQPLADAWIAVAPAVGRALAASDLHQLLLQKSNDIEVFEWPSVAQGLAFARSVLTSIDRLVVTGSFYTVAEVRELLI
ncbi:MAG TPA: bifunctional tetrahydrofolate synthase/dihydrofolate synthase [Gammaproteobacteria bacterium]|nr:bifunctional tetrahydrofolate synthase/dihydrofolate synthase [Gammaproteobacteria bacterium]